MPSTGNVYETFQYIKTAKSIDEILSPPPGITHH